LFERITPPLFHFFFLFWSFVQKKQLLPQISSQIKKGIFASFFVVFWFQAEYLGIGELLLPLVPNEKKV